MEPPKLSGPPDPRRPVMITSSSATFPLLDYDHQFEHGSLHRHFRSLRIFAMYALAAAEPFTKRFSLLPRFELEPLEARRFGDFALREEFFLLRAERRPLPEPPRVPAPVLRQTFCAAGVCSFTPC